MKKIYLTALASCLLPALYAQDLYQSPLNVPLSGMEQVFNENPYVVQQVKDSSGGFVNSMKSYWEPSIVPGYKKFNATYFWEDNAWKEVYSLSDSIVVNNDGLISAAIEKTIYDYPGYMNKQKQRYSYTYNPDKTLKSIKVDIAPNINSNAYSPYITMNMDYSNGLRTKDSIYYFQQQSSFVSLYSYNSSGKLVTHYGLNETGDTSSRSFYTYEGEFLKTQYSEYFDASADDWLLQNADSIEYTNSRISKRLRYALIINQGVPSVQPFSFDEITYTQEGKIYQIFSKAWVNDNWQNESKTEFIYKENGKPALGYVYQPDGAGYQASPNSQYLFDFLQSVNTVNNADVSINVFPNPASDVLNFVTGSINEGIYSVVDLSGRIIEAGNITGTHHSINTSTYAKGIYYLRIKSDKGNSDTKFVVAR